MAFILQLVDGLQLILNKDDRIVHIHEEIPTMGSNTERHRALPGQDRLHCELLCGLVNNLEPLGLVSP